MKISTKRRWLSLLLAFLMVLTLTPTALLEGEEGGGDSVPPAGEASGDETPGGDENTPGTGETPGSGTITRMELRSDSGILSGTGPDYTITLEPNASEARGVPITVVTDPDNTETQKVKFTWKSSDSSVVNVSEDTNSNGHSGHIYGLTPGTATVTVSDGKDHTCTITVTVSGIKLGEELKKGISILENNRRVFTLADKDYELFGSAEGDSAQLVLSVVNNKPNVVVTPSSATQDTSQFTVEGRSEGSAVVHVSVTSAGHTYWDEFSVTVESNESIIEYTDGCSPTKPLKFAGLEAEIAAQCKEMTGGELASVSGLTVSTSQGIIYLGYKSPEDTGAGAGSSQTYYASGRPRGPYVRDLTFVPNASYTGETATISFTGTAADGRTFKGKIVVTLEDVHTDVILTTRADMPLDLSSENFVKVCQEQTGSSLSYVVFTLPPASQGVLYRDYKSALDYGSRVTASEKYDRKGLDDVTFVPAQGFVGTVTIGYAGYSATGGKYTGELVIKVTRPLDESIQYQDYGGGEVTFHGGDFDEYSIAMTGEAMRTTGRVSFTPPPSSQGTLYRSWRNGRGTPVAAGDAFSLTQLDSVTFVAADGFDGVVRIPFAGTDRYGAEFSGTVEIHIQSSGSGDIRYTCAPGQSVKLALSDFAGFCQSMTGQRLHYITFPSLPDFNQGTLYHNRTSGGGMGTRVTSSTKYFNSATPYIANLSFWAAENFRGTLEIPFNGCAVSGEAFSGLLVISSGAGDGSGSSAAVRYSVTGQDGVRFAGSDFDTACRQATNSALNYLRFDLPSSGQGILYYDQRAGSAPTALAPSATLYRSGEVSVDRVSFVPARGFSGVATVPYTGWAIDGREFRGVVEITVYAAASLGGLVRYETGGAPVRLSAYDIQIASGGQPASLRLTGLPDAGQGRLYYQYVSPTRYSWQGNTSTIYNMYGDPSVSNLTFIPRAGYFGTVEIPYAAANVDGSSYTGVIRITVTAPRTSASFDDLGGCSAETMAAVDYLASQGVVNGTAPRTYEPGASIRRGDFCLMLSRAFRFNVGSAARGFTDVPADAYYAQAVNEMYALGVVNGVGGGRFQPSATVSRQDAALMVQRALKQAGIDVPDGNAAALAAYGDRGEIADYARGAVSGLVQLGLLPAGSDRISPRADLTRADMALLLHRAMTR